MSKKSKIAKANRQKELIQQYAPLRFELKAKKEYQALARLRKDTNPNRLKNRDAMDGRPRSYMRKFGLSRVRFRELALQGKIPGIKKASW